MQVLDLGLLEYRAAWRLQEEAHAAVVAGGEEQLLLVEHPPVITLGRRPGLSQHILASAAELARRGVEVVESDRGGDITFRWSRAARGLSDCLPVGGSRGLSVSGDMCIWLEQIVVQTLGDFDIEAFADPQVVGVWTRTPGCPSEAPSKIAAIGVRIRRGVTLHGLALNVNTDLSFFDLIVPCGVANRKVISLAKLIPINPPTMNTVKEKLRQRIVESFLH